MGNPERRQPVKARRGRMIEFEQDRISPRPLYSGGEGCTRSRIQTAGTEPRRGSRHDARGVQRKRHGMSRTTLCVVTAAGLAALSLGLMLTRLTVLGDETKVPKGPGTC